MKIFKNKKSLVNELLNKKNIAFVPTMGSIHKGHLSLIRRAKKVSKNVLVSIYINPKQFNSKSDFKRYPRNINKDIALLKKIKIKYLYLPCNNDIYSFKPKSPIYLDKFSKELCGKFRHKHFMGVINVINRFIEKEIHIMSWTLITKATRPDTDTDFYTGQSQSDFDYIKETYKNINMTKRGLILKNNAQIINLIKKNINNNDYLMIKGSHSTGLNKLTNNIKMGKVNAL
jgi:cytidyltransferase-like protein